MVDALDKARTAQGTHTPTVEVDPTNELLDGDDKPLPPDLEDADVVVDESGTRLVHVDPDVVPSPTLGNLEVRQLAGKRAAADEAAAAITSGDADLVRALREEHAGLAARAKHEGSDSKLGRRLTDITDELKRLGASVDDDEASDGSDSGDEAAVKKARRERKAAQEASGQNVDAKPVGRRRPAAQQKA